MSVTEQISASGKLILLGEHAVVYNRPALAIGLPHGLVVSSYAKTEGPIRVSAPEWQSGIFHVSNDPVGKAIKRLDELLPGEKAGIDIVIKPNIPYGAGLGSSAAMSVLLVRALAEARKMELDNLQVRELAHELEKVFHGSPSGLDDAVATFGGLCLFKRDGWEDEKHPLLRDYTRITREVLHLPFTLPTLVIGNSLVPRRTHDMVAKVRRTWEAERERAENIFDGIEACVMEGVAALAGSDLNRLAIAMNDNQTLLTKLGLSCPEIDNMLFLAAQVGAIGVKLTGAGGGGCVVAIAPGHESDVIGVWKKRGYEAWKVLFD